MPVIGQRTFAVIILIFGLIICRSSAEVSSVSNASGKLGLVKKSSASNPAPNSGQPPAESSASGASSAVTIEQSQPWPEWPYMILLIIVLVSGAGILFRKMETER